jgi:hypothetical protein
MVNGKVVGGRTDGGRMEEGWRKDGVGEVGRWKEWSGLMERRKGKEFGEDVGGLMVGRYRLMMVNNGECH